VPAWAVAPPVPSPHAAGLARGMPPQQGAWAPVVPPPAVAAPAESAKIEVGATVEVVEAFKSNSKGDRAALQPGQRGTVVKLDEDGDAFIKFDDHRDKEWVLRANFHRLRVVAGHPEAAQEAPDMEARRPRGVAAPRPAAGGSPRGPPLHPVPAVQPGQAQAQMESRVAMLQAHAAAMDVHHAALQAEHERVTSMQQQVLQRKMRVIEHIQALQGEIEKQKALAPRTAGKPQDRSFDSDASTSAGSPSATDEFEDMQEGATVTVLEDFKSNSKAAKVQLMVGQKGVVCRVDGDGDVLVQFRDHPDKEWITRNNFDKLRVSRARKVPMAEGPTVTEVSDSGVMCRC